MLRPLWKVACWLAIASAVAGCRNPIQMRTSGRIVADSPPQNNISPVQPRQVLNTGTESGQRIAIIDVDGLLLNMDMVGPSSHGENPVSLFREKLDAAAADPCVRAVVVRINSPGGSVTATDIMRHDLEAFKSRAQRPVVACLLDVGASGAYYLATAADLIVANPITITGGIGVILNLYDVTGAMAESQGRVYNLSVKAGENIDLGSGMVPLPEEKRRLLQEMANEMHRRFRAAVIESRPLANADDETNFDGRIFTAQQAHDRGLIDEIGYLDDAVAAAEGLAGIHGAHVVLYHRCNDPPRSLYAVTPNVPLQGGSILPGMPGMDRTRLPALLYLWQPEPTLEKLGGH
ncbi:MAG: S49 family peptidase [Pirellulales bacterium]|nr:S49 family peptidase [Pirellulales bacterium]